MSKVDNRTRPNENGGQQFEAGRDFYNPNPIDNDYNSKFNAATQREINDLENQYGAPSFDGKRNGSKFINDNADEPEKNSNDVRNREAKGTMPSPAITKQNGKPAKRWQLFTSKKLRGKTSLITVMLVLFGGGGAVSIFASPSIAIVQLRQILTQDLNDQLKSFENRHAYLMRTKLKTTTSGSCGVIKIACRFSTMSDKQAERFTRKGITIERDARGSILPNRGRVVSMTFPDPDGGAPIRVNSAEELMDRMQNDTRVRTGMQRAENPWFASMTDKTFKSALRLLGTSKTSRISGDTNEERERTVNAVVDEGSSIDTTTLAPELDENDQPTGRYIGPDGNPMTQAEIDTFNQSTQTVSQASNIKPSSIISSIGKGVLITGAIDSACTVYNSMRMVGALAKVEKARQAAQMTMATLLVPADKILAGVATDSETEFVGNKINNIGGTQQPEQIVDESKIYDNGSRDNPAMKDNPRVYATAFESPGVKAALHSDVIPLDSNEARFSLAGGFIGTLAKVNSFIAMAVSGGNPDPKVISSKCKYVQNPYVRGAALVAGIFAGLGSLGLTQAASITASLAIGMALPYVISMAADIAAGDTFKNLYGSDFGSGSFTGTASIMSTASQLSAQKPLSAAEAVVYTQQNQEALAKYADTEREIARADPFNIYNQYSFLGSIAAKITPTIATSQSSVSVMASSVASIIPTTFASIVSPTKAANTIDRFQQCEDPGYKALGIGADIYCNIRWGNSQEELEMDPVENALYMVNSGNVSADDETGTPLDNDQEWNYKKFMKECANRTVGYGEDQDENQGDGSNCLSAKNEEKNKHFRIFTLDLRVADYMDGNDEATAAQAGSSGDVSSDGWAYPTTKDAVTTSTYKDPSRSDPHLGVDLAQPGNALGKPIYAARGGEVVAAGPASGFGSWIIILHENVNGKTYSSLYGHMKAVDLTVKVGDTVTAGQQISRIGNEGQSSGAHLHFEIWNGNRLDCSGDCSIDPSPIIDPAKAEASSDPRRNV